MTAPGAGAGAPMLSADASAGLLYLASKTGIEGLRRVTALLDARAEDPAVLYRRNLSAGAYDSMSDADSGELLLQAAAQSVFWHGLPEASYLDVLYELTDGFRPSELADLVDLWTYYRRGRVHILGLPDAGAARAGADGPVPDEPDGTPCEYEDAVHMGFMPFAPEDADGDFDPEACEYDEAQYLSLNSYHDTFEAFGDGPEP